MSNQISIENCGPNGPPPGDIETDGSAFWSIDPDLLVLPRAAECEPAMKRLGPLPIPRGSFPLMGFFATVYEHISAHAQSQIEKSG